MTDKGLWVQQTLLLENLDNCILIDNSKSNCKKWRKRNGVDVRFLPDGYITCHTLADHISKLANLDPFMLQLALSFIQYARIHPEYVDEFDQPMKVKKL